MRFSPRTSLLPRDFDPTFERPLRFELQPVDARPRELRTVLLASLTDPWSVPAGIGNRDTDDRWFWLARDDAFDDGRAGRVLVHEIAGRLRVTNTVGNVPGSMLSSAERSHLIALLRDEVVAPLADAGRLRVHESGPVGTLADWIDDAAIEALAEFSLAASRPAGGEHRHDDVLWNRFLIRALPVRDGTGFAEALGAVLERNGLPETAAADLAVQVEQANSLLGAYRTAEG